MTDKEIQNILCAVRGVPKSRETVTKAIDLAIQHNARLTFAHITTAGLLISATPTMSSFQTAKKQLLDLAEFSMLILCDRAQRRGVEYVDFVVREGNILEQIQQLLIESKPDLLVIGKPFNHEGKTAFTSSDIEQFAHFVEQNLNISVVMVEIETDE